MADDWRERLRQKAKTPEQTAADLAAEKQKYRADAARAVSEGLSTVKRVFEEFQLSLAHKYSTRMGLEYNSMNESTFRFDKHVISTKRSPDGLALVIDKNGAQTTLTWHTSSGELLPTGPGGGLPMAFSPEDYVGDLVASVIPD